MIQSQIINDYNAGVPVYHLAKKYKTPHWLVKKILDTCEVPLRRLNYKTDKELIALSKRMTFDDMAEYLYVQPLTLRKHLRKRGIELPQTKTKDEIYIEKQVKYLYLRERLSSVRIARSLGVELNCVNNIIRTIDQTINRNPEGSLSSIGESGGSFIQYHDLANVFPKQRQYARAY